MIILNKPKMEKCGDFVIIKASVDNNEKKRELFYAVDSSYEYAIDKSLNPFVFWALLIAVYEKKDLTIDGPMSKRFLYGIKNLLLPAFEKMNLHKPEIYANELIDDNKDVHVSSGCATGLSGGIDSFCAIVNHLENEEMKLTHLFQFFPDFLTDDWKTLCFEQGDKINLNQYNDELSQKFNLPIIKVYSNFTEDIKYEFGQFNAYCYISHAMLLNGLISKYILASGYSIDSFSLTFADTSYYDLLTSQVVNRPDFEMVAYQPVFNRIDKTIFVADNEIVQQYLNTCITNDIGEGNCTVDCFKCMRTTITLDIIGKLEHFKDVYDIKLYKENRGRIWGDIFYRAHFMHDSFAKEILEYIKNHNIKKPYGTTYYMILKGFKNQILKIKRKLKLEDKVQ